MALPIDVTDPNQSNAETQAFGVGLAANVTPGSVVATQFASASANNPSPPPTNSIPSFGLPANVNVG
jgi:hypothetical protein